MIKRSGFKTLENHFRLWKHSIPDFVMSLERIDAINPISNLHLKKEDVVRVSIRTRNHGMFIRDLPSRKAAGKEFEFMGSVDLEIDFTRGTVLRVD